MGMTARALIVLLGLAGVAEAKSHKHPRAASRSVKAAKHRAVAAAIPHERSRRNVPWQGHLDNAAQFPEGEGYVIRRPGRSFGTPRTVELVQQVVEATIQEFPDRHVLGIGDFSAEHGGRITEHASHQTGHDVDIGLYYTEKPSSYPESFISATEDNLDCEATFELVDKFFETNDEPGGASMIFLDFRVQGLLYAWAKEHGVAEKHLDRMFQFPHGRGSGDGFVRHWPNHDNHIHVRFR
jgi:murein endopeptidase